MYPYNNEEKEYIEFKVKYFEKLKNINNDFENLTKKNKIRVMHDLKNILPTAILNFKKELRKIED